jgi:rhomboid protease GluP
MNLYFVLPLFVKPSDISNITCLAWYGIKYFKQIRNRMSENEKQEEFHRFMNESLVDLYKNDNNKFVYLERIGNTDDHQYYNYAINKNKRFFHSSNIVLIPHSESFEKRYNTDLIWTFVSFGIGAIIMVIIIIIKDFDKQSLETFKLKKSNY